MWDVASLGAGVCAGKERVGCTIDSSCDLSDFDFQERVILILCMLIQFYLPIFMRFRLRFI